jgi:hypothetical protein
MKLVRFSVTCLLRAVVACGFGLACLLYASAPWSMALYSITLGCLILALVGVACRAGGRRAYWAGFAIAGWVYILLATGPWFHDTIGRSLATTRLLAVSYPLLIPKERQPLMNDRIWKIEVPMARTNALFTEADVEWLHRGRPSVYVRRPEEPSPSLLVADVEFLRFTVPGSVAEIGVSRADHARINQALSAGMNVFLEPAAFNSFATLWAYPPVTQDQFDEVGHALFGLLIAVIGGIVGRTMYTTRGLAP